MSDPEHDYTYTRMSRPLRSPRSDASEALADRVGALEDQARLDRATIAYLKDEVAAHELATEFLQIALISARRIGAAVGITMARHACTETDAFTVLAQLSQTRNVNLRSVADLVVETGEV